MTLETLTRFLAWCTTLNLVFLLVYWLVLLTARGLLRDLHTKIFGLQEGNFDELQYRTLVNYKILIIIFNLTPYLVLRLMF